MASFAQYYFMGITFAGSAFFLFIAFGCWIGMEVLKIQEGKRLSRGFAALIASLIYGGIGACIYYVKNEHKKQVVNNDNGEEMS